MKPRPEILIALSLFTLGNALAAPSEGSLGKVEETPLLEERQSPASMTPTVAPSSSPSPATASANIPTAPALDPAPEMDLKSTVNSLREKLTAMENRVAELTRKLEEKEKAPPKFDKSVKIAAQAPSPQEFDSIPLSDSPKAETVPTHPSEKIGSVVPVRDAVSDPELGFANDSSIQAFRSAMILLRSAKYPEAVLAFSSFVENYPDHPLAGTAQFYVGNAYYKQKEYRLAIQEYQRVLTTYDRSTHIAQTLREISDAEDAVRKTEDAARHRQLLMSLFPHSPFALTTTAATPPKPAPSASPDGSGDVHLPKDAR